jgi:hypothetical protein
MAEQNQTQNQNQGTSTSGVSMYSEGLSALQLGYYDNQYRNTSGSIRLAPAFEQKQDGKTYNYDKDAVVFFSVNANDIVKLRRGIKALVKGETDAFGIKHVGAKGNGSVLVIGNNMEGYDIFLNLMEINDQGEVTKDVMFNFAKDEAASADTLQLDWDFENFSGTPVEVNTAFDVFINWLASAERVIFREAQHQPDLKGSGGGTRSNTPKSPTVNPSKKPRDRKVSPGGAAKKPTMITSEGGAAALFDEE